VLHPDREVAREGETAPSARDRLRDVAIEVFATQGFAASVRQIAHAAGVTAGLITHHFGSKDELRAACDDEVISRYRTMKGESLSVSAHEAIGMMARLDEFAPTFIYMLRSVKDGGAAGRAFIEHLISDSRAFTEKAVADGVVKPSRDPEARLRYLVTSSLGGLLIQADLMPGIDLAQTTQTLRRLMAETGLPTLELYTQGLLVDNTMLDEYLLYLSDPPGAPDSATPST